MADADANAMAAETLLSSLNQKKKKKLQTGGGERGLAGQRISITSDVRRAVEANYKQLTEWGEGNTGKRVALWGTVEPARINISIECVSANGRSMGMGSEYTIPTHMYVCIEFYV